jgi:hypothetical protein
LSYHESDRTEELAAFSEDFSPVQDKNSDMEENSEGTEENSNYLLNEK